MQNLIRALCTDISAGAAVRTRVLERLYTDGILKPLTENQKHSVNTILFCGALITMFLSAQLGMTWSFKWAADTIMAARDTGVLGADIAAPILFFFLMICIGCNTWNLENMVRTLYTNKAKNFFIKYFMFKAYKDKQDNFYDNNYYDDYEFNKNNIDNTVAISITVFNRLFASILGLIVSSLAISYFSPIILLAVLALSAVIVIVNGYVVKARVPIS
jgi:ATP-binding cassette subfamily B protein